MISREKVLEKQLDDIRNLVIALILVLLITIPVAVFTQGVKLELYKAFLFFSTRILALMLTLLGIFKKLYEEYPRDPGMWPYLGIFDVVIAILGLLTLIIAMLL